MSLEDVPIVMDSEEALRAMAKGKVMESDALPVEGVFYRVEEIANTYEIHICIGSCAHDH